MASEVPREPASDSASHIENLDYFSQRRSQRSTATKIERVFPIRISNQSSPLQQTSTEEQYHDTESADQDFSSPTPTIPLASSRHTSVGTLTPPNVSSTTHGPPLVSAVNLVEALGSGQRYITKRFNYSSSDVEEHPPTPLDGQIVYRCEDEPIHTPGAIQPFGALIAIQENEEDYFLVRIASENSHAVMGFEPDALFELRCFMDVLTQTAREEFRIRIRTLPVSDSNTDQDVFTVSLTTLRGAPSPLFCAMHRSVGSDLIICEFEPECDIFNPAHSNELFDNFPEVVNQHTSAPDSHVPTRRSFPIHSLDVARKFSRQLGALELFCVFSEIQSQLSSTTDLSTLLDLVVGLVYELTGFHRIMVYQFDDDSSGYVRSELVDPRASTDTYKGLHFPAADIPKQARDLYMINKIRILYDRDQETARLVCRSHENAKTPLDLKHSYLRAMSPIHLKYLKNMEVRASMSVSLMVDGKLWGLISCHNYGSSMRVSLPVRELCRGLGSIASINIEKLMYSARIQARKPLAQQIPKASPSSYISASSGDLLHMFGADFGFLVIGGEARTIGKLVDFSESIALLHYIRRRAFTSVFASHSITQDVKDLFHKPGFSVISGMLVIPLAFSGADFLVFFRQGKVKEMNWAGNPNQKTMRPGARYLEPRSSFKRWTENVIGMSREWTADQIESANILSTLYGRFIEVWRQKDATVQRNRMTRLLIRNAGHELRTPLNSIINYLEFALEETLDEQARTHLQMSLQASKSLVFVVNDLLNLTEVEEVNFNIHEENVDLRNLLCEVIIAFQAEAAKRHLTVDLDANPFTCWMVRTDPTTLRQVVSNLLANAIKYSNRGRVQVQMDEVIKAESNTTIEISFEDEGSGLSEQHLNTIFQSFERILDEDESHTTEQSSEQSSDVPASETTPRGIGLGLAVTARFVRLANGQIRISSEGEGKGTRVSIMVPFQKVLQEGLGNRVLSPETPLQTPRTDLNFGNLRIDSNIPPSSGLGEPFFSPEGSKLDMAQSSILTSPFDGVSLSSPESASHAIGRFPFPTSTTAPEQSLAILVAEDNPLNSRLLKTRLAKRGHEVSVTVNGQDCFDTFIKTSQPFDVILMDMQMPFVDGTEATLLIREAEEEKKLYMSEQGQVKTTIPIIAVSASLKEHSRQEYISAGFNGWVLKPIDFKRLESILAAVKDEALRDDMVYGEGSWDRGGWFRKMDT